MRKERGNQRKQANHFVFTCERESQETVVVMLLNSKNGIFPLAQISQEIGLRIVTFIAQMHFAVLGKLLIRMGMNSLSFKQLLSYSPPSPPLFW